MGVGFGTNLNNKLGLFTPFVHFSRKGRVRLCKSCCCVHLPTGKGVRNGVCWEQLSWIPREEGAEAVSSSRKGLFLP